MPKIKDMPNVNRPRERLLKKGVNTLSNTDLLAILLGSGIKGTNVQVLATQVIDKFGANFLNISIKELISIKGIGKVKALQIYSAIELVKRFDGKEENTKPLTFMDFCAGVGGGRLALDNLGMKCVGFSEIDKNAEKTYRLLFNDKGRNFGDLTKINADKLPDFDVMIAGFPCQAFSILGKRKGIYDKLQKKGEIIFHLIEFLIAKSVKFFIFENVKGLIGHDNGLTLKIILDELDKAGYFVKWKMLNSVDYGVPQMRERVYFVGVQKKLLSGNEFNFNFPKKLSKKSNVTDFLIDDVELNFDNKQQTYKTFQRYLGNKYNKNKFNIPELLKEEYLVIDTRQSDLRKYYNRVPTLRLGRHGILYVKNGKFRKLSGYESFLLQGFDKEIAKKAKDHISDMHLLKQAGNAMTVSTIQSIADKVLGFINNLEKNNMNKKQKLGSKTAKDGFKNEYFVVSCFNDWKNNHYAQKWLDVMGYHLEEIETVEAHKIDGSYKSDVQVEIRVLIKLKHLTDIQNLQVKLVSNKSGFNQIDKRWVETYQELWNMSNNVVRILKYFTGELEPYKKNTKDSRRMFVDELSQQDQETLFGFLKDNQTLIINDILKGRGKFSAEWMLVIIKDKYPMKWALKSINEVLNFFGNGEIKISPRGSINIGRITMQRKGGDNGRPSANMLQFKIDPTKLLDV
jgi:DNA-cytosine methyltransferase